MQLLVVEFGAATYTRFANLRKPFGSVAACIYLFAGTRNAPTAIDGFQASHHAGQITSDSQVAPGQFLQSSQAMLAVIDRSDLVPVQQLGQFACVVAIVLVANFPQGIL